MLKKGKGVEGRRVGETEQEKEQNEERFWAVTSRIYSSHNSERKTKIENLNFSSRVLVCTYVRVERLKTKV